MGRVEIASMPWGVVQDRNGNAVSGTSVTLKNLDGTTATTWSAATGGSSSTTTLTSDVNGTLPRFVEGGQYKVDVPALSITGRLVDAASGSMLGISVKEATYGATGNGTTDDTTAINAAAAAALLLGKELLFPEGDYVIDNIQPLSGMRWRGLGGATLKAKTGSTSQMMLIGDATSDIVIRDLEFDGTNAIAGGALGVQVGGTRNKVVNLNIHDTGWDGIYVRASSTFIDVTDCYVTDTGRFGIVIGGNSTADAPAHILIARNTVEGCNDSTFGIVGVAAHATFADNFSRNSGHDGIAAYNRDNRDIIVVGNQIEDTTGSGNGVHLGGDNLVVSGNIFRKVNGYAIFLSSDPNPPSTPTARTNCEVKGNIVDQSEVAAGGAGIYAINYTGLDIGGNFIYSPLAHGINLEGCSQVSIGGGVIRGNAVSAGSGIRLNMTKIVSIAGVTVTGFVQNGIVGLDDGVTFTTDVTITGCTITDNGGWGIQQPTATGNAWAYGPGTIKRNTSGPINTLSTTSKISGGVNTDRSATIASAGTISPPVEHEVVFVTGTTAVTGISSASRALQKRLTLVAVSGFTLTNGGGLVLGSNIVLTANQATTICCADGANWYRTN